MKKVKYETDIYWIGQHGVYLELSNTKEFIDEDGIKRIVFELKDKEKINKVMRFSNSNDNKCNNDTETIVDIPDI